MVFALFALLAVNSVYLAAITFLEWRTGLVYQNYFYLWMFMAHLVMGVAITLPFIVFGFAHARNANNRPNRWAKRVGWALLVISMLVLVTGFLLTRVDVGGVTVSLKDPLKRDIAYWIHVLAPLAVICCSCCTGLPDGASGGRWELAGVRSPPPSRWQ